VRLADGTLIRTLGGAAETAIVRPEKMEVAAAGAEGAADNRLAGEIAQAVYSGASVTYRIKAPALGEKPLLVFAQNARGEVFVTGAPVVVGWAARHTIPVAP
jgi:putative spermidine/putrescine transport system ATP-binding protein/spermidine/putrescine transport system ATP-binding protein